MIGGGVLRINNLSGLFQGPVLFFELLNPIYRDGDLTFQNGELFVGAAVAAAPAAAVRDRRPGRGNLALNCGPCLTCLGSKSDSISWIFLESRIGPVGIPLDFQIW